MKYDVFISYYSKNVELAEKLLKALEDDGVRCWMAPRNIPPGHDYSTAIPPAVKKSKLVVVLCTKDAYGSPNVKSEIRIAFDNKVRILPFKADDSKLPEEWEYYLSFSQWLDAHKNPEKHLGKLVEAVRRYIPKEETSVLPPPPTPPRPRPYAKWLTALTIVCLMLAGMFVWRPWTKRLQISPPTGSHQGQEYVDLGLSVQWATCNLGASIPSEAGDYYAWGEIATKSEYTVENSTSLGNVMDNIAGDSLFDAARANLGGGWRLPTKSELEELKGTCTWLWGIYDGQKGYQVTAPNGNSIFLPAAGMCYEASPSSVGGAGHYWSSSPYESDSCKSAYAMPFNADFRYIDWRNRSTGRSIRPVFCAEKHLEKTRDLSASAELVSINSQAKQEKVEVTHAISSEPVENESKKSSQSHVVQPTVSKQAEAERIAQMVEEGKGRDGVYQVGDYYNRNGKQGVVFAVSDGGRHGKIVSLSQSQQLWCSKEEYKRKINTGASDQTNGMNNQRKIAQISNWREKYPAFKWCADQGDRWYLPAIEELKTLLLNDVVHDAVNRTLEAKGATKLFDKDEWEWYWSSTEYDYTGNIGWKFCAWIVDMRNGNAHDGYKGSNIYVRAVSAF